MPTASPPISVRDLTACSTARALRTVTNGLVALAGIMTLSIGALRVMDGAMSAGALIAAMMIVWRVLMPIQTVSLNIARLRQTLATVGQINDVIRIGTDRERDAPPNLSRRLSGNILASGLYLSFNQQAEPQLRSVNLDVKAGEIVAITGPSGGGKSTLLKALMGLYPQYMGTIRLGGLDLRQLNPAEIRAAVGYVSQQPAFFDDSLAANFRYAHLERQRRRHSRGACCRWPVTAPPGAAARPGDPHYHAPEQAPFRKTCCAASRSRVPWSRSPPSCFSTPRATASIGPATSHSWPTSIRCAARPRSCWSPSGQVTCGLPIASSGCAPA